MQEGKGGSAGSSLEYRASLPGRVSLRQRVRNLLGQGPAEVNVGKRRIGRVRGKSSLVGDTERSIGVSGQMLPYICPSLVVHIVPH